MSWTSWRNITTGYGSSTNGVAWADINNLRYDDGTYASFYDSNVSNKITVWIETDDGAASGQQYTLTTSDGYYYYKFINAYVKQAIVDGTLEFYISGEFANFFDRWFVHASGFDFTDIPANSTLSNLQVRTKAKLVSGTIYIDVMQARVDYTPPPLQPDTTPSGAVINAITLTAGLVTRAPDTIASSALVTSISAPKQNINLDTTPTGAAINGVGLIAALSSLGAIASSVSVGGITSLAQIVYVSAVPSGASVSGVASSLMYLGELDTIAKTDAVESPTLLGTDPPPPPPTDWEAIGKEDDKEYVYKVYDRNGDYLAVWPFVTDELAFTQALNTPGTTTTVQLPFTANTTKEARGQMTTQAGERITTEDGSPLAVTYEVNNTVGEGSDVDLGYRVDMYVHYGEFGHLLTQSGEPMTTQDGDYLIVASGAPTGKRIFSGFVLDYESAYAPGDSGVTVTLASWGYYLSQEVIRSGTTTNITYTATEISAIIKDILDTNPGVITYDSNLQDTGVTVTQKFQLNTKLEGIQTLYDQTPDGWYWYGDVADNVLVMKDQSLTADHTFIVGKHLKQMKVKRSLEGLINKYYFVGGQTDINDPATTVYKYYEDTTSQTAWGAGLIRTTDRRYTVAASMQRRADKEINRYKDPAYTSTYKISSSRYDLESIKLGQMVQIRNSGNFIDGLLLQIINLSYTPTEVTIDVGRPQLRQIDIVSDVQDGLANEQYETIPNAPS